MPDVSITHRHQTCVEHARALIGKLCEVGSCDESAVHCYQRYDVDRSGYLCEQHYLDLQEGLSLLLEHTGESR